MDFKEHLGAAWQNTLKFIGPVLILTLVQIGVSVCSFGILAPVTMAGYMQSLLRALREGREPDVKDLFSEMRLFLPLALYGLVVMVVLIIGFTMLVLPGILMTGVLVFGTIYLVPLMTDKKLGLIEALKESWEMATREPWTDQIILTLLFLAILSLGGSVIVAVFFTQPLATFLLLSVYEERLHRQQSLSGPAAPPPPPPPPPAE